MSRGQQAVRFFHAHPSKRVAVGPLKRVVETVIARETSVPKVAVTVVFCDDPTLQGMNARFLNHDYPTDVLAFPLGDEDGALEGEIYVSLDRAEEQARSYGVQFENEVCRLVVHGLLHLLGYDDQESIEKKTMHARQEEYVGLFDELVRSMAHNADGGA